MTKEVRITEVGQLLRELKNSQVENERLKQLVGYLVGLTQYGDQKTVDVAIKKVLGKDFPWGLYGDEFEKFMESDDE